MSFFRPDINNNNEEVNAERFPVRAAQREAALRERVMMDILERQRNNNNNNNNNNNISSRPGSMNNMSGINAERFPNNVSEREAELRVRALEDAELRKIYKPGMERYMFDREAADERYSRNVMNSIIRLLPKHEAVVAKEHVFREKHVNKAERNAEQKRLARQREMERLASLEYVRASERAHAADAARRAEAARLAEAAARAAHEAAEENARRQAMQEFLRAQALRPEAPGLRRANATIEGVPGRRYYYPPGPERRKSRKPQKNNNKTRRR